MTLRALVDIAARFAIFPEKVTRFARTFVRPHGVFTFAVLGTALMTSILAFVDIYALLDTITRESSLAFALVGSRSICASSMSWACVAWMLRIAFLYIDARI